MKRWPGWPWLAVLLVAGLAAQPLWGLPPLGDDLLLHAYRIPLVNSQWAAGMPLVRWQPDLIYGYGSPLFNFYPPLSAFLLTGLYWLVGQQAAVALNLLFALCLLLGAVGMFILGKSLTGEIGGLLGTAVFTLSPHVAAQIYSRGSISNSLALALVPWVAWLIWRNAEQPSARGAALGALAVALLILSHTATSFLLFGPLLLWGGVVVTSKGPTRRRWRGLLALFGLGLALSALSWLPALSEIQFTRYAAEAAGVNYADHFAALWDWPGQAVSGLRGAFLPKTVGLASLLLGAVGTAVSAWVLLGWLFNGKGRPFPAREIIFLTAGLLGWGVLFLTTAASDWLWHFLSPLQGLQFPWRLLDVPAFFLPLAGLRIVPMAGGLSLKNKGERRRWLVFGLAAVMLISYVNLIPYLYPPRQEALPAQPTLADVTAVQQQFNIIGLTAWGEYSDGSVMHWPAGPPFAGADQGAALAQKLLTAVPENELIVEESSPWQAGWQSSFTQPQRLTLATHYFPGWQARLDGERHPVAPDENGRLQLLAPAGSHSLTLEFGRTPVRWLADLLSLAGLVILFPLVLGRPPAAARQDRKQSAPSYAAPLVAGLAVALLILKVGWLDRFNSLLVLQPENGRIPGIPAPDAGNFSNEIALVGVESEGPDRLTLYWQALQPPSEAYRVALTLLDGQGIPRQTIINPTPGFTLASHWFAGQLVRDAYQFELPGSPPTGYNVQLSLLHPNSDQPLSILDAQGNTTMIIGRLKQPSPQTAVPTDANPVGALFGEGIVLAHARLPDRIPQGEPLDFSLYWQAETAVPEDYTVFVHLLKPDGAFVAGQDGQPVAGLYPTSFWEPGEIVEDGRSWLLDVPPGDYQLQVGLYLLASGERLPVTRLNSSLGDRVVLQTVTVTER